jgi:hypothetical protein
MILQIKVDYSFTQISQMTIHTYNLKFLQNSDLAAKTVLDIFKPLNNFTHIHTLEIINTQLFQTINQDS